MKKTRAKKFKVGMFYHLQNLFWGVFVRVVFGLGGFCLGGVSGGLCLGDFVPIPFPNNHNGLDEIKC